MTICVTNCLHWIGFHLVNRLLEEGNAIDGLATIDSEGEEERLFMFGRNSSFTLYNDDSELEENTYTELILLDYSKVPSVCADKTYNLVDDLQTSNFINIKLPLLFGEWMPMDEKGIYESGQYIPFDSDRFQREAIYIGDFIDCFMQWRNVPEMPRYISLSKEKKLQKEDEAIEKKLFIRENRPIEKQVNNLINHYKKVKKSNL